MRQCGNCGTWVEGKTRFCPDCGLEFELSKWDIFSWDLAEIKEQITYIMIGLSERTKRVLRAMTVLVFFGIIVIREIYN